MQSRIKFLEDFGHFHKRDGCLNLLQHSGWDPSPPLLTADTIEEFVKKNHPFKWVRVISFVMPEGGRMQARVTLNLTDLTVMPFTRDELVKIFQAINCFGTEKWERRLQEMHFLQFGQKLTLRKIAEKFQNEIECKIATALLTI